MNVEKLIEEWKEIHEKYFNGSNKLLLHLDDEVKRPIIEKMIYWLAKVYVKTSWKKICQSKYVTKENVFDHNIQYAGSCATIPKVNDRLCHELGLQYVAVYPRIFEELDVERDLVLDYFRKSPMYLSIKAMDLGDWIFKNLYMNKKAEEENEDNEL